MADKLVKPQKLKGFQDFSFAHCRLRHRIVNHALEISEKFGFQAMSTPSLEYAEVLLGVGGETDKQVYRFVDNGGREVALRFDLTVPFARFIAENTGKLSMPFRRFQIGNVWRAEKPQKGRFREFSQLDMDIVGIDGWTADAEILCCLGQILGKLDQQVTISVGNRAILSALLGKTIGQLPNAGEQQVLIALDKLDKIGPNQVCDLICEVEGTSRSGASELLDVLALRSSSGGSDLGKIKSLLAESPELEQINRTIDAVAESTPNTVSAQVNLSIARGLGYYTGIVFETTLDSKPDIGSICSGGRYDNLVGRFTKSPVSGVGGSIGLDRLVSVLLDDTDENPQIHALIATSSQQYFSHANRLAQKLREQGYQIVVNLGDQKLGAQFKQANKHGYPWVIVLGEDEVTRNVATVKRMATGEETRDVSWEQVAKVLARA